MPRFRVTVQVVVSCIAEGFQDAADNARNIVKPDHMEAESIDVLRVELT